MASSKGSSGIRNLMFSGKHALLPPKSPFHIVSQTYADHMPKTSIGSKVAQKPREGNTHHQRTSSESFVTEEQPLWLDDLLNEPETPVRKGGHRRSSSDSSAYLDTTNVYNVGYSDQDVHKFRNMASIPSWSSQDFDHSHNSRHIPLYAELRNRAWDSCFNAVTHRGGALLGNGKVAFPSSGLPCPLREAYGVQSAPNEKHDSVESGAQDSRSSSERKDGSNSKPSASETDTKHAKQQFAQRSRVRKLQYIAELERNLQGLHAEGFEVSAELEFLNHQNLILSMENKTLKQRLESLAQEKLIKYLEQEVLEREIGRLRALYQQQQQQPPQPPPPSHRRTNSKDLETRFANIQTQGHLFRARSCDWGTSTLDLQQL